MKNTLHKFDTNDGKVIVQEMEDLYLILFRNKICRLRHAYFTKIARYENMYFSDEHEAIKRCQELNHEFSTNDFTVVTATTGEVIEKRVVENYKLIDGRWQLV